MNLRIIYPTDDGGVAVIIPAPEARRRLEVTPVVYETVVVPATEVEPEQTMQELVTPAVLRDETDEEFVAWIAAKDVPEGKPFKILDVSEIPADRLFRAAWEFTS
jgi:hypothetical protein